MRFRMIPFAIVGMALTFSLAGCDKVGTMLQSAPIINHIKVEAKVGKPGLTIQGHLKDGAPSNLPVWEGATVLRTRIFKSVAGDTWSATLSTKDPYGEVVAGMATGFQNEGWQVQSQDLSSGNTSTTVLTVSTNQADGLCTIATDKDKTTHIDYALTLVSGK